MAYIDGFVLPIPRKNLDAYRALAEIASKVWKDHGALEYRECVVEDGNPEFGLPFAKISNCADDEVPIFAYIVYKSRQHRDEVNAKVMADERLCNGMKPEDMPFDCAKMAWGGFETLVHA
ncbi:MAG: DUF1428 domain-containing protein [Phycisphaerales bacterium]